MCVKMESAKHVCQHERVAQQEVCEGCLRGDGGVDGLITPFVCAPAPPGPPHSPTRRRARRGRRGALSVRSVRARRGANQEEEGGGREGGVEGDAERCAVGGAEEMGCPRCAPRAPPRAHPPAASRRVASSVLCSVDVT